MAHAVERSSRSSLRVSGRGPAALFFFALLHFAVLEGPAWAARAAGRHAWVAEAVGALLLVPVLLAMIELAARFPGLTIYQYAAILIGRPAAFVGNGLLLTYGFLLLGYSLRVFSDVVQTYLLPNTPAWAIVSLVVSSMSMATALGPLGFNRLAQLLAVPAALATLLLEGMTVRHVRPAYLAPVWPIPAGVLIAGATVGLFPFFPIKVLPALLGLARDPARLRRPLVAVYAGTAAYKVLITALVTGVFGEQGTKLLAWSALEALRIVQVPLLLLEELGLPGLIVFQILLFVGSAVYFASLYMGIPSWLNLGPGAMPVLLPILAVTAAALALLPQDRAQLDLLRASIQYGGYYASVGYPFLLWLVARLRRAGVQS